MIAEKILDKKTRWFDGIKFVPGCVGLYQRLPSDRGTIFWSYWNGRYWGLWSYTAQGAINYRRIKSSEQSLDWRGLAKDPGAK
jgi:hypothetical protein